MLVTSTQLSTLPTPSISVVPYDPDRFHCSHERYVGSQVSRPGGRQVATQHAPNATNVQHLVGAGLASQPRQVHA